MALARLSAATNARNKSLFLITKLPKMVNPPSPRPQTLTVKAFSALVSPPAKAVVYEQHGPPDSVARSEFVLA